MSQDQRVRVTFDAVEAAINSERTLRQYRDIFTQACKDYPEDSVVEWDAGHNSIGAMLILPYTHTEEKLMRVRKLIERARTAKGKKLTRILDEIASLSTLNIPLR